MAGKSPAPQEFYDLYLYAIYLQSALQMKAMIEEGQAENYIA